MHLRVPKDIILNKLMPPAPLSKFNRLELILALRLASKVFTMDSLIILWDLEEGQATVDGAARRPTSSSRSMRP